MIKKTLVWLTILAGLAGGCTENKDIPDIKPSVIREYLDLNRNGEYDYCRTVEETEDTRTVVTDNLGYSLYGLRISSPLSGETVWENREYSREQLENLFAQYNYPEVDSIRFINPVEGE